MSGIVASGFKCRMPDHDGDEEWTEVNEYSAQAAAEQYSEDCDSASAMERFEDDEPIVIVKGPDGVEQKFKVSRDFNPTYFASEIDPKPEPVSDIPI